MGVEIGIEEIDRCNMVRLKLDKDSREWIVNINKPYFKLFDRRVSVDTDLCGYVGKLYLEKRNTRDMKVFWGISRNYSKDMTELRRLVEEEIGKE